MTIERKIILFTICTLSAAIILFFTFNALFGESILYLLLPFLMLIPTLIAIQSIQKLREGWKLQTHEFEKEVKLLEEKNNLYLSRENELKDLVNGINAAVFSLEVETNKWFISNQILKILGYNETDLQLTKHILEDSIHPEDKEAYLIMKRDWIRAASSISEFRIVRQDEQIGWIELSINSIADSSGNIERIFGIVADITERKKKEEKLKQMAFYDTLTDLPNRIMLQVHLKKAISRARRKKHDVTIMFLDLDGFKQINDSLGHDAGDLLLKEVAIRLNSSVREEDLISRLGGDEFILVLEETNIEEITNIAERIIENISTPYTILDNIVSISTSIGISVYPEDGMNIETLIKNADKAMYFSKNNGKNTYHFYTQDLEEYQPKESVIDKILNYFKSNA